ncbi:MAG: condensation domain-containing protein, partial [Gammaproteobacteria bacterium]
MTMVVNKYENIYELSPLQSGLLFQALYQPQSEAYFVQHIFELDNINPQYWYKIWHIVINRCDALRANFVWEKVSKPLQRIQREVDLPWIEEDWTQDANLKEKLQHLIQSERGKRFDLNKSLLMRFN